MCGLSPTGEETTLTLRMQDYAKYRAACSVKGFDLIHQLMRFRYAKNMSDAEALAIAKALSENVKSYDQVIEVRVFDQLILHGPDKHLAPVLPSSWEWPYISSVWTLPPPRTSSGCNS